jgi:N-acetylmuramic acid 6-phosphate etherase
VEAVRRALPSIGAASEAAARALAEGGRILYVGAGTSGRLGLLDASEMGPTFGAPQGRVVALLAGGPRAVTEAVEGAEDDAEAGRREMEALRPSPADFVLGITMSGTAAYVAAALRAAEGSRTALLTANAGSPIGALFRIHLELGPEALAGSTRLKGGSATKAVLNIISTAAMAATGAVYGNLMVRVRPVNRKLRDRAERIVARLAPAPRERAAALLREAGDRVEVAVVMARLGLGAEEAEARLRAAGGSLRKAIG